MRRNLGWAAVFVFCVSLVVGCSLFKTKSDLPYYDPAAYTAKATTYRQLRVVRGKQINGGADYGTD